MKALGDRDGIVGRPIIHEDNQEGEGAVGEFGFDVPEELRDDATFVKAGKDDAKLFFHEQAARDGSIRA